MAKSVVGLFKNMSDAESVVRELTSAGFNQSDISVLASNENERYRDYNSEGEKTTDKGNVASGAMKGAGTGAAIGGGVGLIAGLASLAIPGFGPVIAAGPVVAALTGAGIGAAAGGIIGALTKIGVSEEDAPYFEEGVRRGGVLVTVRAEDEALADRAADIMRSHDLDDVDERVEEWRRGGWQTGRSAATYDDGDAATSTVDARGTTVPIVEEQVHVAKRAVRTGGARIYTHTIERPFEESVTLREEKVVVERRPVDRPVTDADRSAFQERTIELIETREEPVVRKTARVVEEVHVGKEVREQQETVRDTVRKTDVDVEPLTVGGGGAAAAYDYDEDYRQDFQNRYSSRGDRYERYAPAYRFGESWALQERHGDRDWSTAEPELRRDWKSRGHGSWEDFKDSIRYGWDRIRNRR